MLLFASPNPAEIAGIDFRCSLPKLGIVIATEHGAVRLAGLSHMETYAFRHGYGFHSPLIQ